MKEHWYCLVAQTQETVVETDLRYAGRGNGGSEKWTEPGVQARASQIDTIFSLSADLMGYGLLLMPNWLR
jgi:hypothetical protein